MNIWRNTYLSATIFALLATVLPASARNEVLVLQQQGMMFGKSKVWVAPNVVRVDFLDSGFSTVFQKNAKILLFNAKCKSYFQTDLPHWQGFLASRAASLECANFQNCSWSVVGSDKVAGLPVQRAVLSKGTARDSTGRLYWFFTKVPISYFCRQALSIYPPMPVFPGYPLRIRMLDYGHKTLVALDTLSWTMEPLHPETFSVPRGYKHAASETEVERTPAYTDVLDEVRSLPPRHR